VIGVLVVLFCHLEASVRVVARPERLEVRNLMRTRSFDWPEVLGISFPMGDPWAHLDLADGRTHPLHAIQRYDGQRAISAAHRLLHLVQERGEAHGPD
jgi:predicted metalloprotease